MLLLLLLLLRQELLLHVLLLPLVSLLFLPQHRKLFQAILQRRQQLLRILGCAFGGRKWRHWSRRRVRHLRMERREHSSHEDHREARGDTEAHYRADQAATSTKVKQRTGRPRRI